MKDTGIKFETLRKGFNFKKIFIGLVVIVAIGSVIILKGSKANYTYQEIIPFAEGEVHIKKYDFKIMAMYQQKDKSCTNNDSCYQEITTNRMPSDGYKINESKSGCYKDSNKEQKDNEAKLYTNENGEHVINNLLKEDKCYLYFDIDNRPKTGLQIAKAKSKGAMPEITGPACDANTNNSSHSSGSCTMSDSGIYITQDDEGTSYVYRGTIDNNWVKFGTMGNSTGSGDPIWWRIIRVNGDGSVRMIYAGTGATAPADSTGKWASSGTNAQITGTHTFGPQVNSDSDCVNSKRSNGACYNDNKFVGYMFHGTTNTASTSYDDAHNLSSGTITNSNVKKVLDDWYEANLTDESHYLSGAAGFCGDREVKTESSYPGDGSKLTVTSYGARYRNYTNKTPSLKCTKKSNDLYTTPEDASEGNKKLKNPIGLITADEVAFAGGYYGQNNYGYWLYTGSTYWTMSPYRFDGNALVFLVDSDGYLNSNYYVTSAIGVRPVINLSADTTFAEGGAGTTNNPYIPT